MADRARGSLLLGARSTGGLPVDRHHPAASIARIRVHRTLRPGCPARRRPGGTTPDGTSIPAAATGGSAPAGPGRVKVAPRPSPRPRRTSALRPAPHRSTPRAARPDRAPPHDEPADQGRARARQQRRQTGIRTWGESTVSNERRGRCHRRARSSAGRVVERTAIQTGQTAPVTTPRRERSSRERPGHRLPTTLCRSPGCPTKRVPSTTLRAAGWQPRPHPGPSRLGRGGEPSHGRATTRRRDQAATHTRRADLDTASARTYLHWKYRKLPRPPRRRAPPRSKELSMANLRRKRGP